MVPPMSAASNDLGVGECSLEFLPDELEGFEKANLHLEPEDDGDLVATLIRTVGAPNDERPAVLYLHGFVDYFFQKHLADAFEDAGFRFYALELRRYGRSLRKGNRPCFAHSVKDYFEELDWALENIKKIHPRVAALVAHSTGGLIASLYLDERRAHPPVERLVLNSPFLRFNFPLPRRLLAGFVIGAARVAPKFVIPQTMSGTYGKTLHESHGGEWKYDLSKKPLEGFPLYAGWFRMVRTAHARVERGLSIPVPILLLHSDTSRFPGAEPTDADRSADLVLNVAHMRKLAPKLGEQVTLVEVPGGVHDLTLSQKDAREFAIRNMVEFVGTPTIVEN